MSDDRIELLGDEDDAKPGGPSAVGELVRSATAPECLALASLVLATTSVLGVGLLNGSPYLPQQFSPDGPPDPAVLALVALLGAGLALVPLVLGAVALRRLGDDSPSRTTAGAGVLLAAVALVLRLVITVRTATDETAQFVQF